LAYLIQLDVDVTGNITAKLCEVGSKFKFFFAMVTKVQKMLNSLPTSQSFAVMFPVTSKSSRMRYMATAAILNLFIPQKLPHTTVDIPTKV
jgi:hypothetical protein